jgi:hypothetical protein
MIYKFFTSGLGFSSSCIKLYEVLKLRICPDGMGGTKREAPGKF